MDGPPAPGDGDGSGDSGSPSYTPAVFTNGLWLEILTNSVTDANYAWLNFHGTDSSLYYELLSKYNLDDDSWMSSAPFFGAIGTNVTPMITPKSSDSTMFYAAIQLAQNVQLSITNDYVTTTNVTLSVIGGIPDDVAFLVNSTNFSSATWLPFTNTQWSVNLGSTDGNYVVWLGSVSNGQTNWSSLHLILDRIPPTLVFTNTLPTNKPIVQLQGFAREALATITYSVTNDGRRPLWQMKVFQKNIHLLLCSIQT